MASLRLISRTFLLSLHLTHYTPKLTQPLSTHLHPHMSSLFSVSKLLGKARKSKKAGGALSRTDSSATMEKAIADSISPSLDSVAVPQPPPTTATVTLVGSPLAGPVDKERVDSSFELDDDMLEILPPLAGPAPILSAPTPADAEQIEECATPAPVVEEPTYSEALHPERKTSEADMEWTELDGELNEPISKKGEGVSLENDEERAAAGTEESTQPTTNTSPVDEHEQMLEDNSKLAEQVREVQEALRHSREELEAKSVSIENLKSQLEKSQAEVEMLTKEKEQSQRTMEREHQSLLEEIERMKGILAVERLETREQIESVEKERDDLQAKSEAQSDRIDGLEERLTEAQEEAGEVYARNHELESGIERSKEDLAEVIDQLAERDNHIQMLEMNNETISARLVKLQSDINSTERQNRMLMDQIRQQSHELQTQANHPTRKLSKPTKGFTNGASSRVEGAMRAVNLLNDEIYQTAAAMTDQLEGIAKRFVIEDDGGRFAMAEYLKSMLGSELLKILQAEAAYSSEEYNHFFIQVGLQGCLIASCMQIITSWYPTEWEYGNFLAALYERIRGTSKTIYRFVCLVRYSDWPTFLSLDGPEIALDWRAATQRSCTSYTDRNTKLVAFLTERVNAVLTVCGWSNESEADKIVESFEHKLLEIASLAMRLNEVTATGEAGELEGLVADSGSLYDLQEMWNDAPFEPTNTKRVEVGMPLDETVVCTVGLGLRWSEGDDVERLLVKPRVVLYGALW